MSCEVSELIEAQKDYLRWKKHVQEKKRRKEDPDLFKSFKAAKVGSKVLLSDFSSDPNDSVITIFKTENENFKIDAISNNEEFELHRNEYEGEDVVALVFYKDEEPFVKKMKSQI
jgi:hypothetical protein